MLNRSFILAAGLIAALLVGGTLLRDQIDVMATAESVRLFVAGLGVYGPVVFVALFLFRSVLLIPSVVLLTAGGACFGILGGTIFGALGLTTSAAAKVLIAHLAGRDRLVEYLRRRTGDVAEYANRPLGPRTLAVVTAYPIGPAEVLHIAAIVAGMNAASLLGAVFAGSLVRAAGLSLFGDALVEGRGYVAAIIVLTVALVAPFAPRALRFLGGEGAPPAAEKETIQ